jgi:hypothetical protein
MQTLELRLATGKWKDLPFTNWNNAAGALASTFNVLEVDGNLVATPPAFLNCHPSVFLRTYDAFTQ